jgi:hypothetical protein
MPKETEEAIKQKSKDLKNSYSSVSAAPKHKYVYLLGINKKETKELKKQFEKLNPKLIGLLYPKVRGS